MTRPFLGDTKYAIVGGSGLVGIRNHGYHLGMAFVEELQALTEERAALNARIEREYAKRGLPSHVPLVHDGSDAELTQLRDDSESLKQREADLFERYPQGGATQ